MSYVIGICGGSASGKTYLLNQLLDKFAPEEISLISQDNYYKKREDQVRDEEGVINFDHPDSLDLDHFVKDMKTLISGKAIDIEEYTFNNADIKPRIFHYEPTPIIILEGLFIFYKQELAKLIDLKIFVDAEEDLRFARRLKRDLDERGYSFESTIRDYTKYVAPMYKRYVAPTKTDCDLIVQNNHHMDRAVQVIVDHLKARLISEKKA